MKTKHSLEENLPPSIPKNIKKLEETLPKSGIVAPIEVIKNANKLLKKK